MATPAERADDAQWWATVTGVAPHWLAHDPEALEVIELRTLTTLDVVDTYLAGLRRARRDRLHAQHMHRARQ